VVAKLARLKRKARAMRVVRMKAPKSMSGVLLREK
jgi:hypothetical protein